MLQTNVRRLIVFLAIILFCTACNDRHEVERRSYVIAIGIDKSPHAKLLKVSYLIANPEYGSLQQGGGGDTPPKEIITIDSPDFILSKQLMNSMIPKGITYDLLEHVVISEKLARDNNFPRWMYDAAKDSEIRRDISLVVSKESPEEFFNKTNPKFETRPHKYFGLIKEHSEKTGLAPQKSQFLQYFRILEANGDLFSGTYAAADTPSESKDLDDPDRFIAGELGSTGEANQTQFVGSAIFNRGSMVGTLDGEETRLASILNNTVKAPQVFFTLKDPFDEKYHISVKIDTSGNETKMNFDRETPTIDTTVTLQVSILTVHSMTDFKKKENRKRLRKYIEKVFDKKFEKLIKKTQTEFKGQPFGWSLIARKEFKTLKDYKDFNFKGKYPEMDITIKTKVKILEYGRLKEVPGENEVLNHH